MPICIQASLPAVDVLQSENIFVMPTERAAIQDIRPLKIAILNLMPTKLETEVTHEAAMKIKEAEAHYKEEADTKARGR